MRLFIGIPFPENVRARLGELKGGLQGARWVEPENLHLSLRFIGEVPGGDEADIDEALAAIEAPAFPLTVSELGFFDRRGRVHAVWAGVEPSEPLMRLRAKVEHALVRLGHEPGHRKFKPHVTLARIKNGSASEVGRYLEALNGFSAGPFEIDCFTLYRSHLGHGGPHYQALAEYPLEG